MVETDVANCFEAIPHSGLMSAVEDGSATVASLGCFARFCALG